VGVSALSQRCSTGAAGDDARLRDRLAFGDEAAFADLHERFSSLVYTIAVRVTRDRRTAEDVTQEVFLAIWQRPLAFDPAKGSLRGWLAMLAHRRAVDLVRRRSAVARRHRPPGRPRALPAGRVAREHSPTRPAGGRCCPEIRDRSDGERAVTLREPREGAAGSSVAVG
jgi:DNA-directed RNA polymerase specialized sigma24 family protein